MDRIERQGRSWVRAAPDQEEGCRVAGGEALPAADWDHERHLSWGFQGFGSLSPSRAAREAETGALLALWRHE